MILGTDNVKPLLRPYGEKQIFRGKSVVCGDVRQPMSILAKKSGQARTISHRGEIFSLEHLHFKKICEMTHSKICYS
jgi:hypothetical protein